jgi:hypothetical protein
MGHPVYLDPPAHDTEFFIIDNEVHFVLIHQIAAFPDKYYGVYIHYGFQATHAPSDLPSLPDGTYFIRRIVSVKDDGLAIRPVWQYHPIRGELELFWFGRQKLLTKFDSGTTADGGLVVQSIPLVVFIDGFGLYRNMYRSLMGVYLLNGSLSNQERNRRINVIPLILGPHGSNMAAVVDAIGPSMSALDAGVEMDIGGIKKIVCAMPFFFIGDMPQQQNNSGMKSQRANFGCRMCVYSKKLWKDLSLDLIAGGRFHHDVMRTRMHLETFQFKTAKSKADFADKVGKSIVPEPIPLERLAPALDIILTRPSDPAHSEFQGLAKLLHGLLYNAILTESAKKEYTQILRVFPFPQGWSRLQSPYFYLGSYSLSEHGRWTQIIPILLRTWLKDSHIRDTFKVGLGLLPLRKIIDLCSSLTVDRPVPVASQVVVAFSRFAASCRSLMANTLSTRQHLDMPDDIRVGREMFQDLHEAAALASSHNPASRSVSVTSSGVASVASSRAASPAPSTSAVSEFERPKTGPGSRGGKIPGRGRAGSRGASTRGTSTKRQRTGSIGTSVGEALEMTENTRIDDIPTDDTRGEGDGDGDDDYPVVKKTKGSIQYSRDQARPNVHTGLHYPVIAAEYGLPSNVNVLIGEAQHKEFKAMVYNTNKQNPERDLLQRINMELTSRLVLQGGFQTDEPLVTQQMLSIGDQCPSMFERMLPRLERADTLDDDTAEEMGIMSDTSHIHVKCRMRLQVYPHSDAYATAANTDRSDTSAITSISLSMVGLRFPPNSLRISQMPSLSIFRGRMSSAHSQTAPSSGSRKCPTTTYTFIYMSVVGVL